MGEPPATQKLHEISGMPTSQLGALTMGSPRELGKAHTCNPSYSGGRDQEDQGSKPALSK
jgi:hypothetical protein